jgi:hypothetical protein
MTHRIKSAINQVRVLQPSFQVLSPTNINWVPVKIHRRLINHPNRNRCLRPVAQTLPAALNSCGIEFLISAINPPISVDLSFPTIGRVRMIDDYGVLTIERFGFLPQE